MLLRVWSAGCNCWPGFNQSVALVQEHCAFVCASTEGLCFYCTAQGLNAATSAGRMRLAFAPALAALRPCANGSTLAAPLAEQQL